MKGCQVASVLKMLLVKLGRPILASGRSARNFIKRSVAMIYPNIQIDSTVSICWSASIDPAGGEITIGQNCSLDKGVILRAYGGFIRIGHNCTINPYCIIYGGGGLKIGNGVLIAAHTVIVPSNHIHDNSAIEIRNQGLSLKGISIEDDVWIGAGAKILDGVTLAKGTVVGAGSVVTRSTAPYSIVGGVPARMIALRGIKRV